MSGSIDHDALRAGRLARLQAEMRADGLGAALLFHESNIRYATGATAMPVWSMTTFVRCAVVPADGEPILFEHPNSIHRSRLVTPDVRPMVAWEFCDDADELAGAWADSIVDALRELGATGGRLALDRVGQPGALALAKRGLSFVDAAPTTLRARWVKTPEEIALFRANGELVMQMLADFEAAIAPGVRERDLLGVLANAMFRGGGEYLSTNTVCGGPNTNPWRAEATDRALESGDLVFVDTDTVGIAGIFYCVSRTFAVGDAPSDRQRAVHRDALEWLEAMRAAIRPGLTVTEIAERAPVLPARYLAQRYEVMVHGIGLEEESPSICYPGDRQWNGDVVIEEGMTLVAEVYAGEVGARDGVKVGDEVL
ncbi:MAG TPA: Xaa-Pro peptidase family protein, partial [Actinomycetota bacterium]